MTPGLVNRLAPSVPESGRCLVPRQPQGAATEFYIRWVLKVEQCGGHDTRAFHAGQPQSSLSVG